MPARASEHLTFRWTGVLKSEGRREGNCSFLNSASALMRNECFREDEALSKPGFRMMDTPPPGFDEREEEFGDNTKNGLFQQVVNHPGNGRMDIVDNLNVIAKAERSPMKQRITRTDIFRLYAWLEEGSSEDAGMKEPQLTMRNAGQARQEEDCVHKNVQAQLRLPNSGKKHMPRRMSWRNLVKSRNAIG